MVVNVGVVPMITLIVLVVTHPLAPVTVTVCVPGDAQMVEVVGPALHEYVPPPVAVSMVQLAEQTVVLPVRVTVGFGNT